MSNPSVLLVDDEARLRETLARMLSLKGFTPATVDSGQAALDYLAEKPTDAVVLDMRMPGLTGLQTLERIKESYPDTEVIILTAYASVDEAVEFMRLGAADYLLKPFDPEDVVAKLKAALARRKLRNG